MFVLDVPFTIHLGQKPETIPIWKISVDFYKTYYDIQVDQDWDRPHHVQAVCPWFHPHHPEWCYLKPGQEFIWKPTEGTFASSYGWFILLETVGEYQAGKMYIGKLHCIPNTTDHEIAIVAGQIELDPLSVPIAVPEIEIETSSIPVVFAKKADVKTILVLSEKEWSPETITTFQEINKQYHVVPVRLPVVAKKGLGVRTKNAWWLKSEEQYVDWFEMKYQNKEIPGHLTIQKIDHEAEWLEGSVIGFLITKRRQQK